LLRDDRHVEKSIARPMIAMRLGVDDVPEQSAPFDLALQAHGVARLVRRVDQYNTVGSRNDAVIGTLKLSLDEHIGGNLLHGHLSDLLAVILSASEGSALRGTFRNLKEKNRFFVACSSE
jgi:hypothetical protein